jgi:2-keto-4-pentenoate hydratase/2-oxohepta-3-ene-1,7-dioic acid hydratase in catechol pathway
MRMVTYATAGSARARPSWQVGLLAPDGDAVIDATRALAWWRPTSGFRAPSDALAWYDRDEAWSSALFRLDEALRVDDVLLGRLREADLVIPVTSARLGSPVPRPGKIVCIGLNYRDHAAEAQMAVPDTPVVFGKFPTSVIGSGASIVLPRAASTRVDYEAELAVVIGRRVRGVTGPAALDAVLGYMNANDVSARDWQKHDGQWVRAKSCDTFAPLGPWLLTADDVPDPSDLAIRLRLNGKTMQDSSTREFVFDIAHLIAFLADSMTLEPGDVILTGTPPGVGYARRPPVYLAPGDVVEVEIDGLGILRNPVTLG